MLELGIAVERLRHLELTVVQVDLRAGNEQVALLLRAYLGHVLEELTLVGENRVVLLAEPVVPEQFLTQEHGRTRHREHVRGVYLLDVVHRALVLRVTLELREVHLRILRQVVDHRPPNRARHLREVRLGLRERQQLVEVERMRVVLVQDAGGAVVDAEGRIADRPVARCPQRGHHDLEVTERQRFTVRGVDDVVVAEGTQVRLEVIGRVVGQQHPDVLAHIALQHPRVEVITVPV